MIAVVQRVSSASVVVDAEEIARIGRGLLLLLGVVKGDQESDADLLADKIAGLRIFPDEGGKMNRSLTHEKVLGQVLAVSQFTLLGDLRKGRRPSFDKAEEPARAKALFDRFVKSLRGLSVPVKTGVFGAMMDVALTNDGPVTFVADTRQLAPRDPKSML